jgi:hypothetical protein
VESDIEAERAARSAGFETKQCAVGDKWILWETFLSQWKCRKQYYLEKVDDPEFQALYLPELSMLEIPGHRPFQDNIAFCISTGLKMFPTVSIYHLQHTASFQNLHSLQHVLLQCHFPQYSNTAVACSSYFSAG